LEQFIKFVSTTIIILIILKLLNAKLNMILKSIQGKLKLCSIVKDAKMLYRLEIYFKHSKKNLIILMIIIKIGKIAPLKTTNIIQTMLMRVDNVSEKMMLR